ncbi:MAG: GNAT family N-acetyltransferase [Anaerolineales bacterium]|nr:GNAT family N-acetyltransferase [Anaerolineales bacterium]
MATPEVVHLRWGTPADKSIITALLKRENMGEGIDPAECLIAEADTGLLGFARVEEVDGESYLRPIIVSPQGKGKGIGRFLMQGLQQKWDKLLLVARGDAVGFYRKLGFEIVNWQELAEVIHQECVQCPDIDKCCPTPMCWLSGNSSHKKNMPVGISNSHPDR